MKLKTVNPIRELTQDIKPRVRAGGTPVASREAFSNGVKIFIFALIFLFASFGITSAHTEAKNGESEAVTGIILEPDIFPSGAQLPIFIEIKDRQTGEKIEDLDLQIIIIDSENKEVLKSEAKLKGGNYFFEYKFAAGGDYEIHAEFTYKNNMESLRFKIFVSKPAEDGATSIIIFAIAGFLALIALFFGIKTKKIKTMIVWIVIIIIAAALAYSLNITLKSNPSLGIVTCPKVGTCFWTAHIHSFIPVSVCGKEIRLPIEVGRLDYPHTHEEKNINHWHDKLPYNKETNMITDTKPLTLGAFFDSIEIKFDNETYDDKKNGDLCPDGKPGKLTVFANGKLLENPSEFIWKDKDVIRIFFDTRTREEIEEFIKNNPVKFPALGRG